MISEKNYGFGGTVEEKGYEYTYYPSGKVKSLKIVEK